MPVCCLAEVGQPKTHTPEPTQPRALRRRYPCDHPSRSAPRRATAALAPASSGVDLGDRERLLDPLEARPQRSSSRSRPNSLRPPLEHVRRRAKAGARVDERGAAESTAERQRDRRRCRPSRVWPPSRYRRASISGGRAREIIGVVPGPCSSRTTLAPPSASSAATTAPPAPAPTTQTSAFTAGPQRGAAHARELRPPRRPNRARARLRDRRSARARASRERPARRAAATPSSAAPRGRDASASSIRSPTRWGHGAAARKSSSPWLIGASAAPAPGQPLDRLRRGPPPSPAAIASAARS